jgi:A/G-specific adenine glycosylase
MKAAKVIVSKYDGTIPQDTGALEALPGVGRYTAAAIQSFAFRENVPAIDTNFNRVFQRFFGCPENDVAARAEGLYAGLRSTGPDLNQAIMDLGAMVCKSRNPGCASCPLASSCDFFQNNRMEGSEPARRKVRRSPRTVIDVGIACIHRDGKYLVGRCLRSKGGKWEFPGGKRNRGEDIRSCLKREVKEELGVEVSVRPPFLTVERPDRSYIFRLHFCRCKLQRGRVKALEYEELAWLTPREISQIPFPRANAKAVQRLQKMKN